MLICLTVKLPVFLIIKPLQGIIPAGFFKFV